MTHTLRLHYAPDNASLCVRLALEECGLAYETVLVDRAIRAHKSSPYLALNPNGLIPVLETDDGPVFETAAILIWLADRDGRLLPAPRSAERAHAIQWMIWLSNTLHVTLRMLFYPDQYVTGATADLHTTAIRRLVQQLDILQDASHASWLDSNEPSALACYLAPMLRWAALYGGGPQWFDLSRWPRLYAFAQHAETRPAALRAAQAEGLGPTPFSIPQPCNPPEGSAL